MLLVVVEQEDVRASQGRWWSVTGDCTRTSSSDTSGTCAVTTEDVQHKNAVVVRADSADSGSRTTVSDAVKIDFVDVRQGCLVTSLLLHC